jgi:hypothetical protein
MHDDRAERNHLPVDLGFDANLVVDHWLPGRIDHRFRRR